MDELKTKIKQALAGGSLRFGEVWDAMVDSVTYDKLCDALAALMDDGAVVASHGAYVLVKREEVGNV